jgi:hypothetical protein
MWATAEEVIASGAGQGFGCSEIGSITVNMEYHVTGMEVDNGIGVSGAVIEELG